MRIKLKLIIIIIILSSGFLFAKNMSVQVKKGEVRSTPGFLGKIIGSLNYGNRVLIVEEKGSWIKIKSSEKAITGWMHNSALSKKKIVLNPGASDVEKAASSNELALAGKGFNQDVENEFKTRNPDINFAPINMMEKITVSTKEIIQFRNEGGLSRKGGQK